MKRSGLVILALSAALVAVLAWRWREDPAPAPAVLPAEASSTRRTSTPTRPEPEALAPRSAILPVPGAPPAPQAQLSPAGQAVVDRVAMEALPQVDQCIGPVQGQRALVPLLVSFTRTDQGYALTGVQPLPGAPLLADPVLRCLDLLVGRPLPLAEGDQPQVDDFSHPVNLFLPASPQR